MNTRQARSSSFIASARDLASSTLSGARELLENPLTPSETTGLVLGGLAVAGALLYMFWPKKTAIPQPPAPVPGVPAPSPIPAPTPTPVPPTGRTINLTEADNGTTVSAMKGDIIFVTLMPDVSGGYTWALSSNPDPNVVLPGPVTPAPDGSGALVYTFSATGTGTVPLLFAFARPWEGGSPSRTAQFTVAVS